MAILAECSMCHKRQSVRNRRCLCGEDLDRQKRSKKVKYWVVYRVPGGKQRWEPVGYSIEEARASEGKRRAQKKENRILDIKRETKMTFSKLTEWFLNLEKVKAKAYYPTLTYNLASFNAEFGNVIVSQIKPGGFFFFGKATFAPSPFPGRTKFKAKDLIPYWGQMSP